MSGDEKNADDALPTDAPVSASMAGDEALTAASDDGELLSDDEKEALLEGVNAGVIGDVTQGDSAHSVMPYEIRPDAHINYGSYPRLQAICQQMAKRLEQQWSQLLRCPASVTAEETFGATYATAINKTRAPVITLLLELAPLPGHGVVILDNDLLAGLVESFFGFVGDEAGASNDDSAIAIRQQFTQGELRVSELATEQLLKIIPPAWEKLIALTPRVLAREFDPMLGSGIETKERVIVCKFLVQTGSNGGYLRVLLPMRQLVDIADDLEGASNARNHDGDPHWRECMKQHLAGTEVKTDVMVGKVRLPLRKVIGLKAGDLLPLDSPELARLLIAGKPRATGGFGRAEENNAFRLMRWLPTDTESEY